MRVRFHAEEWIGDFAFEIDPKGPTDWTSTQVSSLIAGAYDKRDYFRYERWFDFDDNCPQWIKDHDGPFWVEELKGVYAV